MGKDSKPAVKKVQDFLHGRGLDVQVVELADSTRTAVEAAQAIGCTVSQIAKSLIFRDVDNNKPVLVVASGTNRVSLQKVTKLSGLSLTKADAEFVKNRVGYSIGGVPPVAHSESVTTLLDQDLQNFTQIWAAGGTPHAVFTLTPTQLADLTQGQWLEVSE